MRNANPCHEGYFHLFFNNSGSFVVDEEAQILDANELTERNENYRDMSVSIITNTVVTKTRTVCSHTQVSNAYYATSFCGYCSTRTKNASTLIAPAPEYVARRAGSLSGTSHSR